MLVTIFKRQQGDGTQCTSAGLLMTPNCRESVSWDTETHFKLAGEIISVRILRDQHRQLQHSQITGWAPQKRGGEYLASTGLLHQGDRRRLSRGPLRSLGPRGGVFFSLRMRSLPKPWVKMKPDSPWRCKTNSNKSSTEVRETAFALVWWLDHGWPPGAHQTTLSLLLLSWAGGVNTATGSLSQDKDRDITQQLPSQEKQT